MSFLNSAFLFALAAVSIPLIIHFLSKRRIKTIEFSSLRFLEQMQRSRMRWLKIKELLLLILRMLIIALIVMAFARPTLKGFIGSSKAASSVVLVIDRSASMEAEGETGTIFEESIRMAARLLDILEPGDRVTIIAYPGKGSPEAAGPVNPGDYARNFLRNIEPGFQAGSIGEALGQALDVLEKSPDLNREIYIFSDLQSSNWDDIPPEVLQRDLWKDVHLFIASPRPAGGDNVGITQVEMPPQILVPGETFDLEAELINYGSGTMENILAGAFADGERRAQTTISLPPGHPTRVKFSFKLDSPGYHGGYIEIDYDRYAPDNRRYFGLQIPRKMKILAVGSSEASLRLIDLALNRQEAGNLDYKSISAANMLRENLDEYDVVLLSDLKTLDLSRETAIRDFVGNGGGLFVSLGNSSGWNYWNKFLADLAGISTGEPSGEKGEYIIWDDFDYEHPVFSVYSSEATDPGKPTIPDINIDSYRGLRGGLTIGSSSSGINLLVESRTEPVIVFGSGLDLRTGDLPAHSFFVPFLVRSIEYLGSREAAGSFGGIIGELSTWNIAGDVSAGIQLVSPENTVEDLRASQSGTGAFISFTEYGPPGIYTLKSGENTLALLPFNVDDAESSSETISPDQISEILGVDIREIQPGSDLETSVRQARFGRELWKEFLLAALILLIIESLLGRTSPPRTTGDEK
jgi:hypothetical protein